jgi:Integrase zinc binding domain
MHLFYYVEGEREKVKFFGGKMLISHAHDIVGHCGPGKMNLHLRDRYYWKEMTEDINKFVKIPSFVSNEEDVADETI